MTAFDKVLSGIPEMDKAFDYIRLGDNVVWQVTDLEEFREFVNPFVKQAISEKRNLIYIRFASHPPFVEPQEGVKIYEVELSHKFEKFTATIHNIIEGEGFDAFYVFDCLSELKVAWTTDLMMGNFFKVTCPFLFQLDTVAFFPIIRGRHSYQAIAKIRETTQLLLDVYGDGEEAYGTPVDIEYTVNLGKEKDFVVNLLQCRPLQVCIGGEKIEIPKLPEEEKILHIEHSTMGRSRVDEVHFLTGIGSSRGICGYQRILCYFGKTG